MSDSAPNFMDFLEAAGQSMAEAQGALTGSVISDRPILAISEAELDVKAALFEREGGLAISMLSATDIQRGGIDPALLSHVRVRFVAVAGDQLASAPARSKEEVIGETRKDESVKRLESILGSLHYDAEFVPNQGRWLVNVSDPEGRVVRSVVLADEGGGPK